MGSPSRQWVLLPKLSPPLFAPLESRGYLLVNGMSRERFASFYPGNKYLFDLGTSRWVQQGRYWGEQGPFLPGHLFDLGKSSWEVLHGWYLVVRGSTCLNWRQGGWMYLVGGCTWLTPTHSPCGTPPP